MNKFKVFFAAAIAIIMVGCNTKKEKPQVVVDDEVEVADSTVYGVCGSGTSMHSLELVTDAGDTLTYIILDSEADMDGGETKGVVSNVEGGFMAGDKMAKDIFEFTGNILGEALADFISFSSPEAIVLFGGLAKSGDLLMKPLKESMEKNTMPVFKGKVKLLLSELKESDAAVLGASALGWEAKAAADIKK